MGNVDTHRFLAYLERASGGGLALRHRPNFFFGDAGAEHERLLLGLSHVLETTPSELFEGLHLSLKAELEATGSYLCFGNVEAVGDLFIGFFVEVFVERPVEGIGGSGG